MSVIADSAAQTGKLQGKRGQSLHMEAALTPALLGKVSLVLTTTSGAQKDHTGVTAMATAGCCWNAW